MEANTPQFLQRAREFLDIAYPLSTVPNKYKSRFVKVLEGVFRKDYFTLQTVVTLTDMLVKDDQLQSIKNTIEHITKSVDGMTFVLTWLDQLWPWLL
jgi:hypothetical protein